MSAPADLAIRARILDIPEDEAAPLGVIEDGLIFIKDGRVAAVGAAAALAVPEGTPVDDRRPWLACPGFIDLHVHMPQTRVIASYGAQLLDWLEQYTFVEESKLADEGEAEAVARVFVDELLRHGTTSAVCYATVHKHAAEALLREAGGRGMRLIAGKVLMDRNAPEALRDTAEQGARETRELIAAYHGQGRLGVAITPRFAITSTEAQLEAAGAISKDHPDCVVQTHLSENLAELAFVRELFPSSRDYTDVYDRFGLLGPRSIFGHGIHLSERELARLAESGSIIAFCPTSNLFLGSGLFDIAQTRAAGVRVGLASDVGAGTSLSMLATAGEAYKVLQLQGQAFSPAAALRQLTRGNAAALGLEGQVGVLAAGAEADIILLDSAATPLMRHRMERCESLDEELFVLLTLGDDRAVAATYVAGRCLHERG